MTLTSPYRSPDRSSATSAEAPPRAKWCNARIEPSDLLFPAKCHFAYSIAGGAWVSASVNIIGRTGDVDAFDEDDVRKAVEGYVRARLAEDDIVAPIRAGEIR